MPENFEVTAAQLRQDALRWDEIAVAVQQGVDVLENGAGQYLWYLDHITIGTTFQTDWVEASAEIQNFAYRGRDVIAGAESIGKYGVGSILRAMADAYDATDDEASITFGGVTQKLIDG